jgi:hypothetical protein
MEHAPIDLTDLFRRAVGLHVGSPTAETVGDDELAGSERGHVGMDQPEADESGRPAA